MAVDNRHGGWSWKLRVESSHLELQTGKRVNWKVVCGSETSKSAPPIDKLLPARPHLLNLPERYHQPGTKYWSI